MPRIDRNVKRSLWHKHRVQLGGAVLLAVMLPLALRFSLGTDLDPNTVFPTLLGNVCAVAVGHYMFRSLASFPGISANAYVLPSLAISYGVTILVFWALRLDYSRLLFVAGFFISICWYLLILFQRQRDRGLRIAVVPFGEVGSLNEIPGVEWISLTSPKMTKRNNALVADFRADLPDEWERFLADCALKGITVYHYKQLRESLTGKVEIDHLSENSFGSLVPALVYVELKQIADFVTAAIAGVVLSPLFLVVAVAIKIDSPGPVFYRQRRVGAGGRPFQVKKFRTMTFAGHAEIDDRLEDAITLHDDPRITRTGRFLRRTRIDELPQVINIIAGEMSWIGPRPEAEVLSKWYEKELPFYRYRHIVKPGITGWAQVNQGHVADMNQVLLKLHYDFYYIKNFSPWMDILIIIKTIKTVFTGFGSR